MNEVRETVVKVWSIGDEPCIYYEDAWKWFQNGDLSKETWDKFIMACLESLMEKNKDVLDRLKNV